MHARQLKESLADFVEKQLDDHEGERLGQLQQPSGTSHVDVLSFFQKLLLGFIEELCLIQEKSLSIIDTMK
jgi:hypothetical protein